MLPHFLCVKIRQTFPERFAEGFLGRMFGGALADVRQGAGLDRLQKPVARQIRPSGLRAAACGVPRTEVSRPPRGGRLRPAGSKGAQFIGSCWALARARRTSSFCSVVFSGRSLRRKASLDAGLRQGEASARPAQRAGICRNPSQSPKRARLKPCAGAVHGQLPTIDYSLPTAHYSLPTIHCPFCP